MKNVLPPCLMYKEFLQKAVKKFKISIDEARDRYGLLTINEWETLLSKNESLSYKILDALDVFCRDENKDIYGLDMQNPPLKVVDDYKGSLSGLLEKIDAITRKTNPFGLNMDRSEEMIAMIRDIIKNHNANNTQKA